MDKLINYIEYRIKNYGGIDGISSTSSMYYQFGTVRVRVSDHMKYSEDTLKENDYYFVIQPNDTYIFLTSPKYNADNKLYMKIVTYNEAKEFIRTIHEYSLNFMGMTNWYHPQGWNGLIVKETEDKSMDRYSWDVFYSKYLDGKEDDYKISVVNRMDHIVYGEIQKGRWKEKLHNMEGVYNKMTQTQYNTLIKKLEAK